MNEQPYTRGLLKDMRYIHGIFNGGSDRHPEPGESSSLEAITSTLTECRLSPMYYAYFTRMFGQRALDEYNFATGAGLDFYTALCNMPAETPRRYGDAPHFHVCKEAEGYIHQTVSQSITLLDQVTPSIVVDQRDIPVGLIKRRGEGSLLGIRTAPELGIYEGLIHTYAHSISHPRNIDGVPGKYTIQYATAHSAAPLRPSLYVLPQEERRELYYSRDYLAACNMIGIAAVTLTLDTIRDWVDEQYDTLEACDFSPKIYPSY